MPKRVAIVIAPCAGVGIGVSQDDGEAAAAAAGIGQVILGFAPRTSDVNLNAPGSDDIDKPLIRSKPLPTDSAVKRGVRVPIFLFLSKKLVSDFEKKKKKKLVSLFDCFGGIFSAKVKGEQAPGTTSWSREQEKAFENAVVDFPVWEKIAEAVPGKTVDDIKHHYQLLDEDVAAIESGLVPLPDYVATSDGLDESCGGGEKGGLSRSDISNCGKGRAEQECRRGIAWT